MERNSMRIPLALYTGEQIVEKLALLDSGAEGNFISRVTARKLRLPLTKLEKRVKVLNVDGTLNTSAYVTHMARVTFFIGDKKMTEDLMVSGLGGEQLILGMPWLRHYNPQINWRNREIKFPTRRKLDIRRFRGILDHTPPEILIQAKTSVSQTLEHNQKTEEKKPVEELIPDFLIEYKRQFEKHVLERFPESRPYDHAIDLKPGIETLNCKVYSFSPIEQQLQNEFLTDNLHKGYIRPSKSPMASPFFFVSKKEKGAFRPCQDYRELNKATIKNTYPLPLVSDLIDKLKGAQYFTKLDLRNRYNNIRIKDGDQWKAAFKTNKGLYEPMVMFFGLSNSPATFQSFMDDIFTDYIEEGWIVIYMDDILIFSSDLETHRKRTIKVLERLQLHNLFLKPEKCKFDITEIDFLGMIIRPRYIGMDPIKLAGIRDWKPPMTVRGVQSFLGFRNFYRKFIR
uniref:Putative reverse transcriptase-rnase h-integrase n=1 Tax=Moniliophthora roreri TaxID=221103 RepID=A0A0W0G7B0_MONRR